MSWYSGFGGGGGGGGVPDNIIPGDGDQDITGDLSVSGDVSAATVTTTGDIDCATQVISGTGFNVDTASTSVFSAQGTRVIGRAIGDDSILEFGRASYWDGFRVYTTEVLGFEIDASQNATFAGDVTMEADFAHEGTNIGFFSATPVVRTAAYTVTNVTPDRAYDANTSNVAELADVLGTVIADLQSYGLLQ